MTNHDDTSAKGYNAEEDYFHNKDQETLARVRGELSEQRRQQEAEQAKHEHWMRCPKCGAEMQEIKMEGILVDKCSGCGGLYFDQGELELMLKAHEGTGFFSGLHKLFGS